MHKGNILIIDDEPEIRSLISQLLQLEGYNVFTADCGEKGLKILDEEEEIRVIISDVRLPDISGIDLLPRLKAESPLTEIIMLTAYGTIENGVESMRRGAFDYITKGDEDNKIVPLVARAMERIVLKRRLNHLEEKVSFKYGFQNIIGTSQKIKDAVEIAKKISRLDSPVLLLGETGTGKEIFAQAIHYNGKRTQKTFVPINCSALPKDLLESEMFGYKAGAFTGAVKNKKGLFEEADGGTLFLDEIGEMDVALQAKLLRVIETNSFIKAGDTKSTEVDVRIIAATNRNIKKAIDDGILREDLYYRICVMKIELPSLRERPDDIKELADYFINQFSISLGKTIVRIESSFYEKLIGYSFPGNIRELKNIIERVVLLCDNGIIDEHILPIEFYGSKNFEFFHEKEFKSIDEIEKQHIADILVKTKDNKTKASEILGIGLTTLYRKLKKYGIE